MLFIPSNQHNINCQPCWNTQQKINNKKPLNKCLKMKRKKKKGKGKEEEKTKTKLKKWAIKIRYKQNAHTSIPGKSLIIQFLKQMAILTDLWRNLPPFLVRGCDIHSLCICITFEPWFWRRWRSLRYTDCNLWRN